MKAQTRRRVRWFGVLLLLATQACAYQPPADVTLVLDENDTIQVGEPLVLEFTKPIVPTTLAVRVWPGRKDLYDIEGELLPGVEPVLDTCTPCKGQCKTKYGKYVRLEVAEDGQSAKLLVPEGALGPLAQPLVLEVLGSLTDVYGHRLDVDRRFHFQIVKEFVGDVFCGGEVGEDGKVKPLGAKEGFFLFYANFESPPSPIPLTQQFFCEIGVNQMTGTFVVLLADADPKEGAPLNTSKPEELKLDHGPEGFLFTITGCIGLDKEKGLVFESEPFTLGLTIGPITFELRDTVIRGRIEKDEETSLYAWNGTMTVGELYMNAGGQESTYGTNQANFQLTELSDEQVPEDMPRLCSEDPCSSVGGVCDLLDPWPPPEVCQEEQ